jgi:hypothetical protein
MLYQENKSSPRGRQDVPRFTGHEVIIVLFRVTIGAPSKIHYSCTTAFSSKDIIIGVSSSSISYATFLADVAFL